MRTVLTQGSDAVLTSSQFDRYIAASQSKEVKDALMAVTTKAVMEYGAFGAPWMVCFKADAQWQAFFGSDRLEQMAYYLNARYPTQAHL